MFSGLTSLSVLIGIDPGKHSFHLHGMGTAGREMFRAKAPPQQMMRFFGNFPALYRGDGSLHRLPLPQSLNNSTRFRSADVFSVAKIIASAVIARLPQVTCFPGSGGTRLPSQIPDTR
ncbi:hypothetical protein BJB45_08410 [Halomonas huangheensis]|uniref:Uncharacterized protein n=1 Tax=Halomonas huangheensis TaxID=1178482 RepID=W1NCA8_9GAMM|nr:hypothetical protein AR456_18555 [Halomonas huangheensis]ERL52565.1 hypothetical protein BJB45_08410 [Halomonas huangheensis]